MGKEHEQERTENAIGANRSEDSLFFTGLQRKTVALFCGMLTAWMVLASNGVQAAEWAMFKNTIDRQGRTDFIGPQTAELAWHLQDFDMSSDAVIADDGTIYAASSSRFLNAFTPDGSLKWRYFTGRAATASPAIDQDGTIYVVSENAVLHALTPAGRPKWRVKIGDYAGPLASPGIGADGTIYVGVHLLFAFNSDGTLKWQRYTGSDIAGPPAIGADGTIYVPSGLKLVALNPDGSIKWFCGTTSFYGPGSAPAVGADGTIYVNSYDNVLDAISPDGQRLWRYASGGFVVDVPSSPAIGADGTIYIGHDSVIAALYPDGTPKWTYNTGTYHTAPSIGGDGKIYIGDGTGRVLAFNPDGTLAWSYQTGDGYVRTTPAIGSANRMYVGTGSSVFAFQSP